MAKNEEVEQEFFQKLKDAGVEIVDLTPEEIETYATQAREVTWPKLEKIYGKEVLDQLSQ